MSTQTGLQKTNVESARQIDVAVNELINQSKEMGAFERAFKKSEIIAMISDALDSDNRMASVMKMQGKQFGFKTDSQSEQGYPQETVKNCLIEATLRGVEPTGNMFNILGGNCYITKEGCTHILNRMGVPNRIIPSLSKVDATGFCVVPCTIIWFRKPVSGNYCINEETGEHKHTVEIPVVLRKNKEGGIITKEDARTGMAKRDAMAWLIEELTGTPMPIGNVDEVKIVEGSAIEIKESRNHNPQPTATPTQSETPSEIKKADETQQTKFDNWIAKSKDLNDLEFKAAQIYKNTSGDINFYYLTKYNELKQKFQ